MVTLRVRPPMWSRTVAAGGSAGAGAAAAGDARGREGEGEREREHERDGLRERLRLPASGGALSSLGVGRGVSDRNGQDWSKHRP